MTTDTKRYRDFKIARTFTGKDVDYFAELCGVSLAMIYYVLKEQRTSERIETILDTHIKETFEIMQIQYLTTHKAA